MGAVLQSNTRRTRTAPILVASIIVLALFLTLGHYGTPDSWKTSRISSHVKIPDQISSSMPSFSERVPEPKPANATLNFQEIIYLSMPHRTDRQDALSLIAAVSGLKLTMLPGVKPEEVHSKAKPPHIGQSYREGPPLGIWRAHANVWRYIIENDVETALVIEDDIDWDVNIKEIMGALSWQMRHNNTIRWGRDNLQEGWKEDCPYGCDWDHLFVGHCDNTPNPDRLDLHQVYTDPHSPSISDIGEWAQKEFTQTWNLTDSSNIRVLAPSYEPICLMAYGVSRMGAMRMLYEIGGWKPFSHPVDNEIAFRTRDGILSGYTMMPPAFVSWRVGGGQDSDNDPEMNAWEVKSEGNVGGKSENLKNSVRKSLEGYFKKNYWEDMKDEIR